MDHPSVFMSHSHTDKPFARRLSADLGALGAHVWLDEAELKVGDSLFERSKVPRIESTIWPSSCRQIQLARGGFARSFDRLFMAVSPAAVSSSCPSC